MIEPQSSDLNPWIRVASFEVCLILDRWGLSSVRDASEFLGISRQTLSKLNPSHPDGSLRLESLDHVYAIFLHLVPFYFPEKEREAERRKLQYSRSRILELSYRLPEKVRVRVEKERGICD